MRTWAAFTPITKIVEEKRGHFRGPHRAACPSQTAFLKCLGLLKIPPFKCPFGWRLSTQKETRKERRNGALKEQRKETLNEPRFGSSIANVATTDGRSCQ